MSTSGNSFACYRKENTAIKPPAYIKYNAARNGFYAEIEKAGAAQAAEIREWDNTFSKALDKIRTKDLGSSFDIGDTSALLQDYSVRYAQEPFIGLELCPILPSVNEGGQYIEYIRGAEFNIGKKSRGNGNSTSSHTNDEYITVKKSYTVESDSETGYVGKDRVITTNTPINAMFNLRERVDMAIAFRREAMIRDLMCDPTNYNATNRKALTAGIRWDDPNGDPGDDLLTAIPKIWRGEGSSKLVAWTSIDVWNKLRQSSNLLKLAPMTHQGYITPEMFLEIFNLDGLLVSEARENTADITEANVHARMWGKFFGITRVTNTPQLENASFAWTYRWTPPALAQGMEVNLWFDPRKGDFGSFGYKVAVKEKAVVIANDTGFLFTGVIA